MFDNIQNVNTKDLAEALKSLSGVFLTEQQLVKKKVTDKQGKVYFLCPGMISRIRPTTIFNPTRPGAEVFYVNGERFDLDLTTTELAKQLEIEDGEGKS